MGKVRKFSISFFGPPLILPYWKIPKVLTNPRRPARNKMLPFEIYFKLGSV